MTTGTNAEPTGDQVTAALSRLVGVMAEDAIFALAAGGGDPAGALEGLGKRRADTYMAIAQGHTLPRMVDRFEDWFVQLSRASAPVAPPVLVPMMEVVREKITLEIGARGLRSLFSSRPSDKDVLRVKRYGTLAVRALRAVFVADGPIDREEATTIAAVIASLGLPEQDANALYNEPPVAADKIEIHAELEPDLALAIVRGAWLGAALDQIDPREEPVVRSLATHLGIKVEDSEKARTEALARVDARRLMGLAAVDAARYVLSDRVPGIGVALPAHVGTLVLPRRYRDEALAFVGHGAPVQLVKRYAALATEERHAVLGIAWACALVDDPTMGRRALLRARWERVADDLGGELGRVRNLVDDWVHDSLALVARTLR